MSQTTPSPNETLEIKRSSPKLAFALTAVVLAGIFGGLYYMKNYAQDPAPAWQPHAVPVSAMKLTSETLPINIQSIGSLTAVNQVLLSAEASGRVSSINFNSGETVQAGQLLVQLFDGPEQAALTSAKASRDLARSQLNRSQKLSKTGVEPLDALQMRSSTFEQTDGEVSRIEAQLRQKQVIAPFNGQLGIRQVNLGQYLNPGEAVVTLTSLDTLYVEFTVPQQSLAAIHEGATVELTSDAYPERTFIAKVNAVEPQIDEDTRNITVQASLDNKDGALRPGMYVATSLSLSEQQHAIIVPSTAIQTSAQGYSAVVIRGDNTEQGGTAEIVGVQISKRIGNDIVVSSGLNEGDVIVTTGQNRVQPGAQVTVSQLVGTEES